MNNPRRTPLVERLSDYPSVLEVGIGNRTEVAAGLARQGVDVRATDVVEVVPPEGVRFRREDVTTVTDPDEFHRVDAVYALNCPAELHRPIRTLAQALDVPFLFTMLGNEQPIVPVERETLVGDDGRPFTLYVAAGGPGTRR